MDNNIGVNPKSSTYYPPIETMESLKLTAIAGAIAVIASAIFLGLTLSGAIVIPLVAIVAIGAVGLTVLLVSAVYLAVMKHNSRSSTSEVETSNVQNKMDEVYSEQETTKSQAETKPPGEVLPIENSKTNTHTHTYSELSDLTVSSHLDSSSVKPKDNPLDISKLKEVVEKTPEFNDYKFKLSTEFLSKNKGIENLVMTGMGVRPSNLFFQAALGPLTKNNENVTTMPGQKLFAFTLEHGEIANFIKKNSETNEVVTFSAKNKEGKAKVIIKKKGKSDTKLDFDVDLKDIYGDKQYNISYKEIQKVLDSQKIYVSSLMPIGFYQGLKVAMEEDAVVELRYIRQDGKATIERPAHFNDWTDKSVKAFLDRVRKSPEAYGFKDTNAFNELMKLTVYQIGSMVVNSEDWHIFVDAKGQIIERQAGANDAVRLLNACGIRPEKPVVTDPGTNKKIMTETFKTALAAAEEGIVLFPAVGMGVWGGDPEVYWTAFLDAVVASDLTFDAILINPNHRPYKENDKIAGQEFETYLQRHIAKYSNSPDANEANLQKLQRIQNLQKEKTDLVQLARELKLEFPDKIVSLFNASDPDVTFGNHVGEYTNNMPHTTTTEENYTAMGTNGLCFKSITKVHKDKNRVIQVD